MYSLGINLGDKGSSVCIKHVAATIGTVPKGLDELTTGGIPRNATSAIISITAGSTGKNGDPNYLATFTEDGQTVPAKYIGHPIGHQGVYQVIHENNLKNFRIVSVDTGVTNYINISYYC